MGAGSVARRRPQIRRRAVRPPSGAAARAGARPGPRPPPSASLFGEKEIAAPLGARPPGIAQLKIGSEPTPQTGSCGRESRVAAGDAPYLERGAGRRQEAAARARAREWVTTVVKREVRAVARAGWLLAMPPTSSAAPAAAKKRPPARARANG